MKKKGRVEKLLYKVKKRPPILHSGISPELAIRLEKMGWGTADSWLAMQRAYELAQARKREAKIKVRPYNAQPVLS